MNAEPLPSHWVDVEADAIGEARPEPRARWLVDALAWAEALFETEVGPPERRRLRWLAGELEDYLHHVGARSRFILRASFHALSIAGPLAVGKAKSVSCLTIHERQVALERLEKSPLALAVLAVRAGLCILWYEHPEHARMVGMRAGRGAA